MDKQILPLLFCTVALFSCQKDDGAWVRVDGFVDTEIQQEETAMIPINVTSGERQPVTPLAIYGLPPGVSAAINPASGTPDFASVSNSHRH